MLTTLKKNVTGSLVRNVLTGALCSSCCATDFCYDWAGTYGLVCNGQTWQFDLQLRQNSPSPGYMSFDGWCPLGIENDYRGDYPVDRIFYDSPGWSIGFGRGCKRENICSVTVLFWVSAKRYWEDSYTMIYAGADYLAPSFGAPFVFERQWFDPYFVRQSIYDDALKAGRALSVLAIRGDMSDVPVRWL